MKFAKVYKMQVIGVLINEIRDMITRMTSVQGNTHTIIGYYNHTKPAYFDNICDSIHNYSTQNGYANLGAWIEAAAKAHGK